MRSLTTFALAGLFAGLLLVSDASACHKKKVACPCPPPAPVCVPAPVVCVPPPPVCEPAPVVCEAPKKKCGFKLMGHKKKAAPVCETVTYTYAPTYAAPQSYPSAQATGQSM